MTENEAAKCLEFVNQFYDEKLRQRNKYLEVWQSDYDKATETLVYLDEQLEARTMSPERYKARVAEHEATQVRTGL